MVASVGTTDSRFTERSKLKVEAQQVQRQILRLEVVTEDGVSLGPERVLEKGRLISLSLVRDHFINK